MTDAGSRRVASGSTKGPARHERPVIDALGLEAARHADRLLDEARALGIVRWSSYFDDLPDRLRDDEPSALRRSALRARAAYGVKDSVRDALPERLTEPFLEAVDRLLRELNRSRG